MTVRINSAARNAMLDALSLGGTLSIYTGGQPSSADQAPTGTKLAEIENLFFLAAVGGSAQLDTNSGPYQATVLSSGTAGWARLDTGSGFIIDGSVGTSGSGADFVISSDQLVAGDQVVLQSMSVALPA